MKKLRQRVTLNDVSQAIDSLEKQSLNPTADNILAEVIRKSNGTVGGSKSTVLKFKRQLESTDNNTELGTVRNVSTVQYSTDKRTYNTESVPFSIDKKLFSTLEVQLWKRLEARLDDKLHQHFKIYQIEETLQEIRELWLGAVEQYVAAKANLESLEQEVRRLSEFETQITELRQVNERLILENNKLKASTITETDFLKTYFQVLAQLHQLTPVQKYDYAMKLFEQGVGPSEISRILAVNKGTLQHYKEGTRKRPNDG
jgi:regulator of replication initiation timing